MPTSTGFPLVRVVAHAAECFHTYAAAARTCRFFERCSEWVPTAEGSNRSIEHGGAHPRLLDFRADLRNGAALNRYRPSEPASGRTQCRAKRVPMTVRCPTPHGSAS